MNIDKRKPGFMIKQVIPSIILTRNNNGAALIKKGQFLAEPAQAHAQMGSDNEQALL